MSANGGITGVTFDSAGDWLVGVAYLARGEEPKPTVLVLHGCPGLDHNGDLAADLRDQGWNALIFHYRGCWGSQGRYDLGTITADVRAAVDYLSAVPFPGIDPARLAVAGHSMGGWAAIQSAAADDRLKAVVSIGAPARLDRLSQLPDSAIEREFTRFLTATPAELRQQIAHCATQPGPVELISAVSPRPVLIVHGSADEWVPAADGRLLQAHAGEPRGYAEIEGANHAFSWHRPQLRELVIGWLAKAGV
jgi:dienelactone hydrolase